MAYKPFKMKGSPMKRNFGVGPKSPAKHTPTESKGQKYMNEVTGSEDYADVYDRTVVAHNDKHESDPNFTHEGDQPQFSSDRAVRGRKSGPDDPGYAEKKSRQAEADKSPAKKDEKPHKTKVIKNDKGQVIKRIHYDVHGNVIGTTRHQTEGKPLPNTKKQ